MKSLSLVRFAQLVAIGFSAALVSCNTPQTETAGSRGGTQYLSGSPAPAESKARGKEKKRTAVAASDSRSSGTLSPGDFSSPSDRALFGRIRTEPDWVSSDYELWEYEPISRRRSSPYPSDSLRGNSFGSGSSLPPSNTVYHSNGGMSTRVGNTWHHSRGGSSTKVGATWHHSDGSSSSQVGNTFHHSGGGTSSRVGNTWHHSGGRTSTVIGNTIYSN